MTINANTGPDVIFGCTISSSGVVQEYNEDMGPSLTYMGDGILDPRPPFTYRPGQRVGHDFFGWPGIFGGPAGDFVPITYDTSGIAAAFSASAAAPASGTLTLQTSANSSSFCLISSFHPSTYPVSTTVAVLQIDGYQNGVGPTPMGIGFGTGSGTATSLGFTSTAPAGGTGSVNLWNPEAMIGRCLLITNGSASVADTGTTYLISGFDVYGLAMSCKIAGAGISAAVTTPKAFKYISAITWTSTTAGSSTVSIGTSSNAFGFPLMVDHMAYASVYMGPSSAASLTVSAANHTFGYGAGYPSSGSGAVSTSTTADVRGTYSSTYAPNGTSASSATANRLVMVISPRVNNLGTMGPTNWWGLVGAPQA
jgi:hypothetical protein